MKLPQSIELDGVGYSLDGGSRTISVTDQNGIGHKIELIQHGLISKIFRNRLPGRLYFDKEIVPVRSEMEFALIELIENGKLDPPRHAIEHYGGIDKIEELLADAKKAIFDYVLSDEYVIFANWIEVMLFLDGMISFNAVKSSGLTDQIAFKLHDIGEFTQSDFISRRLYFNGQLVPIGSRLENEVIDLIKADSTVPKISKPSTESGMAAKVEKAATEFKTRLLEFVLSENYAKMGMRSERFMEDE